MARETPESFIERTTQDARKLYINYTHAMWQAAISGTEQANQAEKEAQQAQMRFWADRERFEQAKAYDQASHPDPITARALRLIRLSAAKAQQSEAHIQHISELEATIRAKYYNFRPEVEGRQLNDNQIDEILTDSHDSEKTRQAWLASKEIGQQVAGELRQLIKVRNQAAQAQGYRDHFARSLELNEIDESELFELLDSIDQLTAQPFEQLMAEINERRAARFGISQDELGPWHYGNRFFQRVPAMGDDDFADYFKGHDPVPLTLASYDAWGLEVREILDRSDLYPRQGKNQHAFCLDLDRSGDVRTLNNLEPSYRWTTTLHHELGHAVYDKLINPDLPWLLRKPPHTLSTEAVAILAPFILADSEWLVKHLGLSSQQAEQARESGLRRRRRQGLIFTRWVLVMTNFERKLYQEPDSDLDSLWWELKRRYQLLAKPAGRQAPDWAAKYHIALAPVYYQNYLLGNLVTAQLNARMDEAIGGFGLNPKVGEFLKDQVFAGGAILPWSDHVEAATGQPLDPGFFTRQLQ